MGKSLSHRARRTGATLAITAFLGSTFIAGPAFATEETPPSAEIRSSDVPDQTSNRFIVKFRDKAGISSTNRAETYDEAAAEVGGAATELFETATGASVIALDQELTASESTAVVAALADNPEVEYVEPDVLLTAASVDPNDPYYPDQWDLWEPLAGANVAAAWEATRGEGQIVAVVDTGITDHSDLNAQMLPGYDLISDAAQARDGDGRDSNAQDEGDWHDPGRCGLTYSERSSWHGTHVAGTVAATSNNGKGVSGVAPLAKIVPVRVLGECGGWMSDITDGIIWAAGGSLPNVPVNPHPARIINVSIGGNNTCSKTSQAAMDYAKSRDAIVIVAAGNNNRPVSTSQPANCQNVLAVGATGRDGTRAPYSNHGPGIDIMAPGGNTSKSPGGGIVSTLNDGGQAPENEAYAYYQGTSMAAPHVAGAVALMLSADGALTAAEIESRLTTTARDLPNGCDPYCGPKLLDVAAAVAEPPMFADVPAGLLFYDEIQWMGGEGISTGWPEADGTRTYRPYQPVNRDAMAAFMYRLDGSPEFTPPNESPFTDVATSNPFYKEITWLASNGISTGWPEADGTTTYRPYQPVNRDAMAAFMYRLDGSPEFTPPNESPFTDVATSNPFYKEITWLASNGISTGWPEADGTRTYRPYQPVNRDAMAAFMSRYNSGSGR
ncbi:S8 family serine peptidase [Arthrobacter sp. zg-Y895]|uniref:S8 family serine peptidase n=1 Tax=Arthrobacter sp. zg-Y895 TaxID=2886933 RepID=UPI001D14E50B|nr:S8 family serine peptidase [Arthrobacter sp. zg-Y895]MCC3302096.1 S8 family serine peptidase [Arthrobacter sp. zg-Y895]